jgi:hypothetical protein
LQELSPLLKAGRSNPAALKPFILFVIAFLSIDDKLRAYEVG